MATVRLIERPILPGREERVRETVREAVESNDASGPRAVTGVVGFHTASVLLDESGDESTLRWFLEADRRERADGRPVGDRPVETLRDGSPPHAAGLAQHVDDARSRCVGGSVDGDELVTHVWHPERPRDAVDVADEGALVTPADARDDPTVGVAHVEVTVIRGPASWFVDRIARQPQGSSGGWIERSVSGWEEAILRAEGMYTETIFVAREPDRLRLLQYMEADSFERVYRAYSDTWNPMVRATEFALRRLLERPERFLEGPVPVENELLVHAVGPRRPRTRRLRREANVRESWGSNLNERNVSKQE
ncbi:hypothetical protein [Halovivax sp.]|uniref:hypothetical protein n=1 Tax=Halovivax sp. TaxID=1935978 RepID=UPI0025C68A40|nr:hypothetical protein [Halovivax sp.]